MSDINLLAVSLYGAYAVCIALSAVFFRRFVKTKARRSLWTGLALLFGPPGVVILYVAVSFWLQDETPRQPESLCYMRAGGEIRFEDVKPQTEEEKERWGGLAGKYSGRVSTETFHKLSGGVFDAAPSNVGEALKPPK